ncbi:MAG: hypothetical protein JSV04_05280, partial [Candidatus Heimdallarchaeota archaeon]
MMDTIRRMKNWKWNRTLFVIIIICFYTGIQNNITNPVTSKAKLNSSGNITWDVDVSLGEYGSINMEATTYSSHSYNPKYGVETGDTISFESLMGKSSCQLKITLENLPGLTDLEGTYQL